MAFIASPSSQHQHCTDEAQKAETVQSSGVVKDYFTLGVSPEVYRFFFLFSRSSMSEEDSSSSWAVRSEMSLPVVSITVDPTSETDQTLLNNLVMSIQDLRFSLTPTSLPVVPEPSLHRVLLLTAPFAPAS